MNKVVELLMVRDGISQEEAQELFDIARDKAMDIIDSDGMMWEVEEVLTDDLGLESDYLLDLIDLDEYFS